MAPRRSASVAPKSLAAFTLTELLVVIVIVAVLAGLLLPVFTKIQNTGRRVQVVSDMRNVKVSIISYYQDYRKYPLNPNQQMAVENVGYDTVYGDPGGIYSGADLFDILRAVPDAFFNSNNALNPNATVYWNGPLVSNPKQPRSGITTQDVTVGTNVIKKGGLVDPWGNAYIVWVDANRDGDLSTAAAWFYTDVKPGSVRPGLPPMGVEFGSLGSDGAWGTKGNNILGNSDDIVTWQIGM